VVGPRGGLDGESGFFLHTFIIARFGPEVKHLKRFETHGVSGSEAVRAAADHSVSQVTATSPDATATVNGSEHSRRAVREATVELNDQLKSTRDPGPPEEPAAEGQLTVQESHGSLRCSQAAKVFRVLKGDPVSQATGSNGQGTGHRLRGTGEEGRNFIHHNIIIAWIGPDVKGVNRTSRYG
jgi:hypothetical protein